MYFIYNPQELFKILFLIYFLAVLGLCCCVGFALVRASHLSGFSCCRARASAVAALRL